MLMVIFGAGASFDSIAPEHKVAGGGDFRPPLANELFDISRGHFGNALDKYRECRPILPRLRRAAREGRLVEDELGAIRDEPHPVHASALTAMRYYLREIMLECGRYWPGASRGVTNYVELLYEIEAWRAAQGPDEQVRLVTFNYDSLLENACSELFPEWGFGTHDAYMTPDRPYGLYKPHGCVTWSVLLQNEVRPGAEDRIEHEIIGLGNALRPTGRYLVDLRPSTKVDESRDEYYGLLPAIAIPLQRKTEFVCPPRHIEALKSDLPLVTRLLIIGWRATEEKFLDLMAQHRPEKLEHLWAVCGSREASDDALTRVLEAIQADPKPAPVEVGFSTFLRQGRIRELLG